MLKTRKVIGYTTIDKVHYCWINEASLTHTKPMGQMYFYVTNEDGYYRLFFMGNKLVSESKLFDSDKFTDEAKRYIVAHHLGTVAENLASRKTQLARR